jgi:GNAT superfamily N-acetyltransferase
MLDPQTEAARVRAFFVHPAHARSGLGRRLLERCEADAQARGFRNLELMATLTGAKLYAKCGFVGDTRGNYELATGVMIEFIPMCKALEVPAARAL